MTEKRTAEIILILKNVLSGLFPVLTVIAYSNSLLPLSTLSLSSVIAAILFASIITYQKNWRQNVTNVAALKDIIFTIVIIGIVVQGLYFLALTYTSAQNVALLSLLEVVSSFLIIGWITKKEPVSAWHFIGSGLMLCSAFIILFNNQAGLNLGDMLIILAVLLAPIGNIFAKRALYQVSLPYLLFLRSLAAAIVFFIAAYLFEEPTSFTVIIDTLPYLLFSGLIFLGAMKIVTMFGFKKTSVTHTLSFGSLKPIFAFIFAWLLLGDIPTLTQLMAIIPSLLGLYILATAKQKSTQYGLETNHD